MKELEEGEKDDVTLSHFSQIISIVFVTIVIIFLIVKILFF